MRSRKPVASFRESLSRLERSDETGQPARALIVRVINRPESGSRVPGYRIWEMKTGRFGPFLPMRLLYSFDDTTVYLLWLEVYEELE